MVPNHPRKTNPNWKIYDLINHVQEVSRRTWFLALLIAIGYHITSFKGYHQDKRGIINKSEGDGFKIDTICDIGFTYALNFCNQPPPKNTLTLDSHS